MHMLLFSLATSHSICQSKKLWLKMTVLLQVLFSTIYTRVHSVWKFRMDVSTETVISLLLSLMQSPRFHCFSISISINYFRLRAWTIKVKRNVKHQLFKEFVVELDHLFLISSWFSLRQICVIFERVPCFNYRKIF